MRAGSDILPPVRVQAYVWHHHRIPGLQHAERNHGESLGGIRQLHAAVQLLLVPRDSEEYADAERAVADSGLPHSNHTGAAVE